MNTEQALTEGPTCTSEGAWSGMHCLHASGDKAYCCGPCGAEFYPHGTATASAMFSYRLGASHAAAGPNWEAVKARLRADDGVFV